MFLLILFAFLAGIVTILSPCILPILPIVLSGSVSNDRKKPFGIVTGFVLSFTFFTLFLTTIVKATGISSDILRNVAVVVIILFGLSLIIPQAQLFMERMISKLSAISPKSQNKSGFSGGVLIGLSLGLIWAPCVGPILASVITLAATSQVNAAAFFITLAYSLGSAIPMFAIIYGGRNLLNRIPWLLKNTAQIQKVFGMIMIATAFMIFFNVDRKFQAFILEKFPQYGVGLTKFEDNNIVKNQIDKLRGSKSSVKISDELNNSKRAPNPNFDGYTKWINSEALTLDKLKGKVVLVDFWTYTCINCIRTMPYVTSWYEKYKDQGFVVIGVHTPEFEFEKKEENVLQAMKDFKINYPVVQDNDFNIWNSYDNKYWPAEYLIDANGNIRYTHFGEGEYDKTEKVIQQLLKEAGREADEELVNLEDETPRIRNTPETYLGLGRMERVTNRITNTGVQNFSLDANPPSDHISFGGTWDIQLERSIAKTDSELTFNFNANEVFLVITPNSANDQIKVYLDNKLIDVNQAGVDVINGQIKIDKARLYKLVDLKGKKGEHILRLEFNTSGTSIFAFTFG
ncbi:MAG TPA: cytochrome c biogenesis protein CcdA [Candidatus Nitrosocosmicus sp.]|nr:cytochrome c biogenesis protein CcdA [Candidatus Nitrosocosmicus sp.]